MAITLKEAIERHEDAIQKKNKQINFEKQKLILKVQNEIDQIIALRVNEIIQRPICVCLPFVKAAYKVSDELQALYPEFTLSFSMSVNSVSIKLADKDWDWEGYGIKVDEKIKPKWSTWQMVKERYL